jgi:hypothetical protein
LFRDLVLGVAAIVLASCGSSAGSAERPLTPAGAWTVFRHLTGVVDLAGPRGDGSLVVAAAGRLLIMGRDGTLSPFARGADGYQTAMGTEPYLVLASGYPGQGNHCSFGKIRSSPSSRRRVRVSS